MRAYWETDASMTKILTVDDDRHILTSLSVILQAEGFEVKAFSDGASALDAFPRLKPDLAVIDIKMPRMDGLELLQKLRQKSWLPIIFLTSKDVRLMKFWVYGWARTNMSPNLFPNGY